MKTIYKQSILNLMLQEISIAETNRKRISYFELTEDEWKDLKFELKCSSIPLFSVIKPIPEDVKAIIYGIPVKVEGEY